MNNGFLGFPELREGQGLLGFPTPALPANFHGYPRPRNAAVGTPAGEILRDAVFYIDALDHQRAGAHPKIIRNLGIAGDVLDARSGSTSAADSNDPKFLSYEGKPYIYLPGIVSNFLSVPDEAALRVAGDIDIRVQVAMDDWTPGATVAFAGKWNVDGQLCWWFRLNTSGTLQFHWTPTGLNADALSSQSTAANTLVDGTTAWVRFTMDVDNGAGGRDLKFYTSIDGVTWTQLGATVTTAATTSIFAGTDLVTVGQAASGTPLTGKVFRAQIYNGIAGTKVLDIDTSVLTSGAATSFTALTGQTVTINRHPTNARRSAAIVAPCWVLGTDDYMDLPFSPALNFFAQDSFTVFCVARLFNTIQSYGSMVANRTSGSAYGWSLQSESTALRPLFIIHDSVNQVFPYTNIATANGGLNTWWGIRDRSTRRIQVAQNGTSFAPGSVSSPNGNLRDNTVGSLANNSKVRIGAYTDGIGHQNMELVAVAIYRRVLSSDEISILNTYFQARNP
jgi:hypothetical protein